MASPPPDGPRYAARTNPLKPEMVWTLDGPYLWEMWGEGRGSRREIAAMQSFKLVGEPGTAHRAAHLYFGGKGRGRMVIIPAQSLTNGVRLEDRSADFDAFIGALQKRWGGSGKVPMSPRFARNRRIAGALIWTIALTAAGAVFMIVATLVSGMADLGLALGARLLFAPILLCALLPWLSRDRA